MRFVIISLASFFLIMWSERILLAAFPLCRKGFPHPVKQSQLEKIQDGGEERESYKKKERMRIEREEEGVASKSHVVAIFKPESLIPPSPRPWHSDLLLKTASG